MKRNFIFMLVFVLILTMILSGCTKQETEKKKLSIVCTIFPQYEWVRQILGDRVDEVELSFLLKDEIDLHSFEPSVADIVQISSCDVFIYVGGESDHWVNDAIKEADNQDMIAVNLLDVLGSKVKTESAIEGMEPERESHEDHEEESEAAYDEHVWLSLKNAQAGCTIIADILASLDDSHAQEYRDNLTMYNERLSALDTEYQRVIQDAPSETLLFGDRFAFRYLMDDYSLRYYAAFAGCSAETEASFKTIIFLSEKIDELNINSIIVTESSDRSLAETIKESTIKKDQQILVLDTMQSMTEADVEQGVTYLSVMESNLNILKEALK